MKTLEKISIEELSVNTIRTLSMDAVQKANSGHPGTPMALAPLAYVLWKEFLVYNPKDPVWFNRDRFVLSNGHASMLLYSMLYLTGYNISLEDLKNFRQWGSNTPGHPEFGLTPGVETTTGPLGQGIMNGVGMAMAETYLSSIFNKEGLNIIDHFTYVFCSDGDFMEGASHEAASLAGHLGLGKLIVFYDDNHISIEGKTELTYNDDKKKRFEGYGWHVRDLGDQANDLQAISEAIKSACAEKNKPSLIIIRSHIAYGSPNMHDTREAHGSPLGEEEVRLTKIEYGWPEDKKFFVPEEVLDHMREAVNKGEQYEKEWNKKLQELKQKKPDLFTLFSEMQKRELPAKWDENIRTFKPGDGPVATRTAAGAVLNDFADKLPWLIGGSGDLSPSTKSLLKKSDYFEKGKFSNRNIAWGVREHNMCAASNGIYLHGGLRPFAATFFIFSDYARPAIRLASLMGLPVIYLFTHDSIGLGEDGPTHQPVEHLASFRAMPHINVIRPADANETAFAWKAALQRTDGPSMIVLTRQKVPVFDRKKYAPADGLLKGAYVLSKEKGNGPEAILIGSGSEVYLLLEAQVELDKEGIDVRVVSMPCWEIFREQPSRYKNEVFPPGVKARLAVEAGSTFGWCEWIGDTGKVIGINKFGSSAPGSENFRHYGFTVDNIIAKTKELLKA